MKLIDYLVRLAEPQLMQIGQNVSLNIDSAGSSELAETLLSEAKLQEILRTMPRWERDTWLLVVRRMGTAPFAIDELNAQARGRLTGAQLAVSVIRLCRKGLLIGLRNKRGDQMYGVPADLFEVCSKAMRTRFVPVVTESDPEVSVTRSVSVDLARQLFTLFAGVCLNPVKLTRTGDVPKRVADKWGAMFGGICDDPMGRLSELIDIGRRMRLLRSEEGRLQIDPQRLRAWLHRSADDRNLELYNDWRSGRRPGNASLLHAMLELQRCPVWQWFPLGDLIHSLADDGIIEDEHAALQSLTEWIQPLADYGWIDLGERSAKVVCRLRTRLLSEEQEARDGGNNPESCAAPLWIVQPNFEVVVPPGVDFYALWELEMMAERLHLDSVCLYKITKESVLQATATGRHAQYCLDFLNRHALYEIPENVILGINRWFTGRDSDLPLGLPAEAAAEGTGFLPDCDELFPSVDSTFPDGYDIVVKLPEEEELRREWQEVPPLWIRQSRPYHLSVRKQIVRQAIKWQTAVELGQGNECLTVQPIRIEECSNEACFVGRIGMQQETIGLDSWDRIRLLLPGVNEE